MGSIPLKVAARFILVAKYADANTMIAGFASSPGITLIPKLSHLVAPFLVSPRGVKMRSSKTIDSISIGNASRLKSL